MKTSFAKDDLYNNLCAGLSAIITGKDSETQRFPTPSHKMVHQFRQPARVEGAIDDIIKLQNGATIDENYVGHVLGRSLAIAIIDGVNKDRISHFLSSVESKIDKGLLESVFAHTLFIISASKEVTPEKQHIVGDFLEVYQDKFGHESAKRISSKVLETPAFEIVGAKDGWRDSLQEASNKLNGTSIKAKVASAFKSPQVTGQMEI